MARIVRTAEAEEDLIGISQHTETLQSYGALPYNAPMTKAATIARLEARLPADVHALLKRAAEIEGRSLTDFVVSAAQTAARKTIEETSIIKLSAEDQHRFAEALIDPAPLTPAMERAVSHHRRLIGRSK